MKRILCVITTGFVNGGGLTAVMMNYYRSLWMRSDLQGKYEIDFMSQTKLEEDLASEIKMHGSQYHKLPSRKKSPLKHYKTMRDLIKQKKYDVLHLNCNSATGAFDLLVAHKYIKNRIVHIHTSSTEYPLVHKLMKPLFHHLYTEAVAVSKQSGTWIFGNRPYTVLNNAINVKKFAFQPPVRDKMRKHYNIGDEDFLIGHVGKMHTNLKNQEFLIKIFPRILQVIPTAKMLLVGDGQYLEKLKLQAKGLGLLDKILFAGFHSNINEYMQMFDLFCFPSRYEGLGMVAVEAQAAGLYVLASNKVPCEADVTGNISFLGIDEENESEWIENIEKQFKLSKDRLELMPSIQERIKLSGYDIDCELDRLLSFYEK